MLRFLAALLGAVLLIQPAIAETARPEIAQYVKGYEGLEGAQVWTLRVGPKQDNEALVQVGRVDHALDKKILRCKVSPASGGANSYFTEIDGKRYELLRLNQGSGELYLPGEKAMRVSYSESLSQQGNAEHFLTEYLEQGVNK